jgi:hypothetical protein
VDKGLVAKKDGKASRTSRVEVEAGYMVADSYVLRLLEDQEIRPTGLLKVLELVPREPGSDLPGFIGRWDERAKALKIDIDLARVGPAARQSDADYSGHWPTQLPGRRFQVDLRIPGTRVFCGVVSFDLGRDLALGGVARLSASVSPRLLPGGLTAPGGAQS